MLKKIKTSIKKSKETLATLAFMALAVAVRAQGFEAGLTDAQSEIVTYLDPITRLVMAIGGIVGIVGAVRIYQKWNNGDQDINKELMSFGGSALFLILAPIAVRAMFDL